MKKKIFASFSLFILLLSSQSLFADSVWSGSSDIFTKGSGTNASPYLIESADQLAFIAEMVNAGVTTYKSNYFKLTIDINLNSIEWTPIGNALSTPFEGVFNGDNHTIKNLNLTSAIFDDFWCIKSQCANYQQNTKW